MKFGIRKVTIEELCKDAGISKMTFYRMFSNKNELVFHWLKTFYDQSFEDYNEIMSKDIPFPEKIKLMILLKHKAVQNISPEFMADVYQSEDEKLINLLQDTQKKTTQKIYDDFRQAQKEGWIRQDMKMDSIQYLHGIIIERIMDPNYLALHDNIHDAVMEMVNFFFYGITQHD